MKSIAYSRKRSRAGFSVVELLISLFVMVAVLGIASVFLGQQMQLQRAVQARNDVQDRIRVAMQLLTQDLALAGTSVRIRLDGTIDPAAPQYDCFTVPEDPDSEVDPTYSCVVLESGSATQSEVAVRYLTSQVASATSCREVLYRLVNDVLQRADVVCGAEPTAALVDLAPDMIGFKVIILCSTGGRLDAYPADTCLAGSAYGRSAIVSLAGRSSIPTPGTSAAVTLATVAGAPQSVPCPDNRACFSMTQEVLMPNLKDR